ncbi:nudix hydrolase 13, mitochondrial-like [Mangifera indica]|uniref:nudix hydrolase 13, mitochondrial-like n=1 Tax=Mangifera indica TaxID=29780 RepID=UPI001CFA8B91|nr:nudix hydrolase 13, mitochondrial-like [Mangifera indica]
MSSLVARTGRQRQRYQDQLRLVSGCIPYRFQKNADDQNCNMENNVLVLMISTPNRNDLVFPKGGWEDDETIAEAACREAWEEAGVKGIISKNPLGVWEFRSKSSQNSCSNEGGCRGYMFALEVTEEFQTWPEQANHQRKWLLVEEAFKFCRYDWMRDALKKFLKTFTANKTQGTNEIVAELPTIPVSGTGSDCKMLLPSCSQKPSGLQHLEDSCTKCVLQV